MENIVYPGGIALFWANNDAQDGASYANYCERVAELGAAPISENEYWEMVEFYRS